jgi:hypothetical protein
MKCARWTEPELAQLEQMAGEMPLPMLAERYNTWAAANGFTQRRPANICATCNRNGWFTYCEGEYLSCGAVVRITGIHKSRLERIARDREVVIVKHGWRKFIRRIDLAEAARRHRMDWYGVSRDRLFLLFEDLELAEYVAASRQRPPLPRYPRPVRCLVTGTVFPTMRAAAVAGQCHPGTVRNSCERGSRPTPWGAAWEWV